MFRATESRLNNKAGDENASNVQGKRDLGAILGPRRTVLTDVSNAVNPSIVQKTTLLPKRNLRPTTLQASMATKTKILSSTGASSSASASSRSSIKPCAEKTVEDKENVEPSWMSSLPPVKRSSEHLDYHWDDLDAEDEGDVLMVSEYAQEIFKYMLSIESKIMAGPGFIKMQKELSWHMRAVLVDWLIEVQWKSRLNNETLFLSINIIDRFLARRAVSLVKLQLVGLAGALLASKNEEILSPSISNFIFFSDDAYSEQELLKAERYMLHVLDFNMAYPNPLTYLRRISKADNYDIRHRTLAKYLMEVTLLDHRFVACPPSMMAATAMWLARTMLKGGAWHNNLIHFSGGYTEDDLKPWADLLIDFLHTEAHKYEAVIKKYSFKKTMEASIFVQRYMRKHYGTPLTYPNINANNTSTNANNTAPAAAQ